MTKRFPRILQALGLAAFLYCIPCAPAIPADQVNAPMSDAAFFQRIDLDLPGLELVRAAVQSGDLPLARTGLAAYYRGRTGVFHYVDAQDPTRHISDPGGRLRSARPLVERTGNWDGEYWTGGFFDWQRAQIPNKERMYFFEAFGDAAAVEEGDNVASALVNLVRSFVHVYHSPSGRGGGMWATMNVGIRMRTGWPVAFLCLLQSPAFTDEDIVLFLKTVWDQSDYLRRHPSETSNWLTFEMSGLYTSGVVYPEFKDATEWRRFASETAVEDIGRGWLPDGMTIELSPEYGRFFSNYFVIHDLAKHVGRLDESNLRELPARTEGLFESYLKIMAPNRLAPATNDNLPSNVVEILSEALQRFPNRQDFRWIVTEGQQGARPEFTSKILPYAGFAAMRSGWEREANMLYFDFGPVGYRHAHQDGLTVMLWAYGRQIVFDPGLSGYNYDLPIVNYAVDTFSHNTVLVDNRPQRRRWYHNPHPNRMPYQELTDFRWRTTGACDVAAGIYDEAYGMQGASNAYPYSTGSNFNQGWAYPATHHRRVFFLKPDLFIVSDTMVPKDGKAHTYDLRWHLDTVNRRIAADGLTVVTEDANLPNVQIVPLLPAGLEVRATSAQMTPEILGWNAGISASPKPATTVQHLKSGAGTVQFLTLLIPLDRGQAPLLSDYTALDSSTTQVQLADGRRLLVHAPSDPEHDLAAMFYVEGAGHFEDDFESYPPGTAPTRPDDGSPYFWNFSFGGTSQNRHLAIVPTENAEGEPTQALRLFQDKPLADSRDGLSFSRKFDPITDEEIEVRFQFRLNDNLYSPSPQELGGTYYQLRLADSAGKTAVRLQMTLDGPDGLRDRVTPANPLPGFTLQQGPDRDTDRRNIVPEIRPGDWYEFVIRTYPPDRTFDLRIVNLNSSDPAQSGSLHNIAYAEDAMSISEISGARSWTWSLLDAHLDDVSIRPAPPKPSFNTWLQNHFTTDQINDAAVTGSLATPAGDAVPNLIKYALGLDPWLPAVHTLPRPTIEAVDGEEYLTLIVTRPQDITDVSYSVLASSELAGPAEPAILAGQTSRPDGTRAFTYRDSEPIRAVERRFIRLRVEKQ